MLVRVYDATIVNPNFVLEIRNGACVCTLASAKMLVVTTIRRKYKNVTWYAQEIFPF